jgi:hypothetical protein
VALNSGLEATSVDKGEFFVSTPSKNASAGGALLSAEQASLGRGTKTRSALEESARAPNQ